MKKPLIIALGFLASSHLSSALCAETVAIRTFLNAVYGSLEKDGECRIFQFKEQDYCVYVDSLNTIKQADKTLTYLLTIGNVYDKQTQEILGAHADAGIVGGFILDMSQNPPTALVSTPVAGHYGSFGYAPTNWVLTQIGSATWGWVNTSSYTGQGYSNSFFHILAPKDKSIQELASIPSYMSDGGACERNCTSLEAKLTFQPQQNSLLYPIAATIEGENKGRPFKLTPKPVEFDLNQGKYITHPNWPITGY